MSIKKKKKEKKEKKPNYQKIAETTGLLLSKDDEKEIKALEAQNKETEAKVRFFYHGLSKKYGFQGKNYMIELKAEKKGLRLFIGKDNRNDKNKAK